MGTEATARHFLDSIQPVVLVGGQSRRFGRDKLREPWGSGAEMLVERPIAALRRAFGARVLLVGDCDPELLRSADGVIPDKFAGIGPIGGILSALESCNGAVFILAGDMPCFRAEDILAVVDAAHRSPRALAAWAANERPHPCAGIYAYGAAPVLREKVLAGDHRLQSALPVGSVVLVPIDGVRTANINRVSDLPMTAPTPGDGTLSGA